YGAAAVAVHDFIADAVVESCKAHRPTAQTIIVYAQFGTGADFRLQVRIAYVNDSALTGKAVHAAVQLVKAWGLVAAAYPALEGPLLGRVPHQVPTGADVTAECIMMIVASAQSQHEIVSQAPFVFQKYGIGVLFVFVGH